MVKYGGLPTGIDYTVYTNTILDIYTMDGIVENSRKK